MTQSACVGMLDWGVGGLQCYRALKQEIPELPVIYWSDTGAAPYGKLTRRALGARVQQVSEALRARGATHLLVACNAASTVLDGVGSPLPTLGIIGASRRAVPRGMRGTLGVIGGERTVRSGLHRRLLERSDLEVVSRVAQPLSGHIEGGTTHTARYRDDLARILAPLAHVDALLLACTHYPAIAQDIRGILGPRTRLLDPAQAMVEEAVRRFSLRGLRGGAGTDRFVTTGSPAAMRAAAQRVWGLKLSRCVRARM